MFGLIVELMKKSNNKKQIDMIKKGFKEFDEKAIEQAKKQIIDMIKKDECSWYWEEYRGEE